MEDLPSGLGDRCRYLAQEMMNSKAIHRLHALAAVIILSVGAFLFWQYNADPAPEPIKQAWWAARGFSASIENIEMLPHFHRATKQKDAVLFTDAIYNGWTLRYRDTYVGFSEWLIETYNHRPIFIDLTVSHESVAPVAEYVQPELFRAIQELLEEKSWFGYKNYYGAGVIAWIRNGEIIEIDCVANFNSIDELCERTKTNFTLAR